MKVLELFAGTRSIGKAFEQRGHDVFSVDLDRRLDHINLYRDVLDIQADDILRLFGRPDVIWASPDCSSYSIAALSYHRTKHPDGNLYPKSRYAAYCDEVNQHLIDLVHVLSPMCYFIENPRGGLRKMHFMKGLPRYTVTYCQYGDFRMKPTDIFTNHPCPGFKPACKNGDDCHEASPRSNHNSGTQRLSGAKERGVIPEQLCAHIVKICEELQADPGSVTGSLG